MTRADNPTTALQRLPAPAVRLPHGSVARLVRRELGPDGTLPLPDGVHDAAWWGADLDARAGATVLAGHVNWRSTTGPFAELWRAAPGEHVEVVNEHAHTRRYRITEAHTLAKNDLPQRAPALFRQDGPHRIVLITCGGRWLGQASGYESNHIVIAHPI
ncbi:class F sortase [Micromonospora aurantiaca]|nr:class F sortase [Micromonospora aurantiaca]